MSLENFPRPEKNSFLDKHKSVIDSMKAMGKGAVSGVISGLVIEIVLNQWLKAGMPREMVVTLGAFSGGAATSYYLGEKKKRDE